MLERDCFSVAISFYLLSDIVKCITIIKLHSWMENIMITIIKGIGNYQYLIAYCSASTLFDSRVRKLRDKEL